MIRQLKDRIEELEEKIRQITEAIRPRVQFRNDIALMPKHRLILRCLIARAGHYVPQEALHWGGEIEGDWSVKRLHNFMCTLRERLTKHGVAIHTSRGEGYMITKEDVAKLLHPESLK